MKTRYFITIDPDEEKAVCVAKETEPGVTSILIIARTLEEARQLFHRVSAA